MGLSQTKRKRVQKRLLKKPFWPEGYPLAVSFLTSEAGKPKLEEKQFIECKPLVGRCSSPC